jgi:hypothetical protein
VSAQHLAQRKRQAREQRPDVEQADRRREAERTRRGANQAVVDVGMRACRDRSQGEVEEHYRDPGQQRGAEGEPAQHQQEPQ